MTFYTPFNGKGYQTKGDRMEFKSFSWRHKDSKKQALKEILDELRVKRTDIAHNQKANDDMLLAIMHNYEDKNHTFATVDEFINAVDNDSDSDWRGPTFSGLHPEAVRSVCLSWYDYTLKLIELDEKIEAIEFCIQHLDDIEP